MNALRLEDTQERQNVSLKLRIQRDLTCGTSICAQAM